MTPEAGYLLPVVLLVSVVLEAVVVDQVEEEHAASRELEKRSDTAVLGKLIFVIPAPIGPAESPGNSSRRLVPPSNPVAYLFQLHISKRNVLLPVVDGRTH